VTFAHPAGFLDPATGARVRDSFGRQTMLATLGEVMTGVDPGPRRRRPRTLRRPEGQYRSSAGMRTHSSR